MDVKLYSTLTCPWCHKTREFLKSKGVKFKDFNVADDERAREEMVEKSGQMGVPVIDIDGKIIVGFDEEEIEQALESGDDSEDDSDDGSEEDNEEE